MIADSKASLYTGRNGACDLLRFVFSLLIMGHHIYHIGLVDFPFSTAWIYVEFFFMVSGFFIAQHYEKHSSFFGTSHSAKEALTYTLKKYRYLFYYLLPCLVVEYLLNAVACFTSTGSIMQTCETLFGFPAELFMLSPLTGTRSLVPIWYLSAMLIVMPIICFLYLRFKNAFVYILSWFIPVISIVSMKGVWSSSTGWEALLRAFCYMSLGCFIYCFSAYLYRTVSKTIHRILLTVLELFCFAATIVFTANNLGNVDLMVLLLVIGITIMLSGCSYTIKLQGRFFTYLGKLSLPIYMAHWMVGTFVGLVSVGFNKLGYTLSASLKLLLYYLVTLIVATLLCYVVDKIKSKSSNNQE